MTTPPGDGWISWMHGKRLPDDYAKIEIWRDGYESPKQVDPQDLSPQFNVFGVWWRPSGPPLSREEKMRRYVMAMRVRT